MINMEDGDFTGHGDDIGEGRRIGVDLLEHGTVGVELEYRRCRSSVERLILDSLEWELIDLFRLWKRELERRRRCERALS